MERSRARWEKFTAAVAYPKELLRYQRQWRARFYNRVQEHEPVRNCFQGRRAFVWKTKPDKYLCCEGFNSTVFKSLNVNQLIHFHKLNNFMN